ncbi:MAG: serine/threonine protein kinase [Planctomycetales bacterium]|nr:serine/threonine protein kinase [Planctomycetales bacterium]
MSRLGCWELTQCVYDGPWSRVFRARPTSRSGQGPADYAVKLAVSDEGSQIAAGMLQRAAWLGQQFAHPHLTPVLDTHLDRPPFYFVMPFHEGATLRSRLWERDGKLELPRAFWIARQVAEALAALHECGWSHGDIKPENVQIDDAGHATVLDLGMACQVSRKSSAAAPQPELEWRRISGWQGTPNYAAPETFSDDAVPTLASDLFSLGVTLFEMVTGSVPFREETPERLIEAIRQQPLPEPRRFRPDLTPAAVRLLHDLLARQPVRRPTASETADRLREIEIECFGEWV